VKTIQLTQLTHEPKNASRSDTGSARRLLDDSV
jgi:hypothetical protein